MKPAILLFEISKQQSMKLLKSLLPLKIKIKKIRIDQYHIPIGTMAGLHDIPAPNEPEQNEPLDHPMIVFAGLSGSQLDFALAAIRKSGAGPIPYKAILTPSNQSWNAYELLKELKSEHEKMNS